MKYISHSEIERMKKSGAPAPDIAKAEQRRSDLDALIRDIKTGFADVKLGDGIGLYQAQGLDDYKTDAECAALRENDEQDDWQLIAPADLNTCNSSLSFFDAAGMHFHLPAFLIADLKGQYRFGMDFCLTHLEDYRRDKFSTLSPAQRKLVRRFLELMLDDEEYTFQETEILGALDEYWND